MKRLVYVLAIISLSACNSKNNHTEAAHTSAPNQLPIAQNAPTATTEQQSNSSGLLTNPAHGQPGHDCALPVGAPLKQNVNNTQTNAVPAQTATVPTSQPATSQPVAQQPSSSKKLNPAHGQPGHDCAKPVGAPLT